MQNNILLSIDYPANIATQLLNNSIDIGLVPVAVIPSLKEHYIISDYCIGCDGEVSSVGLFSNVPLNDIENIILDYQSRTSAELLKIIIKEHWKINVKFIDGKENYEHEIGGTTAGLIIGDRVFEQKKNSKFYYDLGTAWKELTGLPFVFAAWVANKKIADSFITDFNTANAIGFNHLQKIINQHTNANIDLQQYYTHYLSYNFDKKKKEALQLFLSKI